MKSVNNEVFIRPESKLYQHLYDTIYSNIRHTVWENVTEPSWVQVTNPFVNMIPSSIKDET